jgi:outer membrane protein assembly factor BamB/TolA-binding protein
VVEQAFCSSWGDEALELLGDLAFQDGRFAEALTFYRRLVPERSGEGLGLVHPDPSVDLARVAAKKLLARAAQGENPPGPEDLRAFDAAYPGARGALAGRTGPLMAALTAALAEDRLCLPAPLDGRWPTFAGAPTRTKVAPGAIDVGSFQWRVKLDPPPTPSRPVFDTRFGIARLRTESLGSTAELPPAYHAIVLGDHVVVCDDRKITAYNLNDRPEGPDGTIQPAWYKEEPSAFGTPPARVLQGSPRYTLTAAGDRIFARTGSFGPPYPVRALGGVDPAGAPSAIMAIERSTEGKLLWRRPSTDVVLPKGQGDAANRSAGFEGTPVADERSVYAALVAPGPLTTTWVVCLDAQTGATRWVRYICAASGTFNENLGLPVATDLGHRLLSLDGPTVYYQTNLGALAALDTETGAVRWVATYPRQERSNFGSVAERDLNPAIVHDDLAIVAPADSPRIFAFEAATGRLAWKTEELPKVAHLLGVAKGRLVATGDHVWSIDVKTGKVLNCWPENQSVGPGYGRGLLAGDFIYWPTRDAIYVLDQAAGQPPPGRPPIALREAFGTGGGNLAVGDGYLIVAQADALVVFCQNSRLIKRYREEIALAPGQAATYFRLARVAEATDETELALTSLEQARQRARPSELIDGVPLVEAAQDRQYGLLTKLGTKAAERGDWAEAARRFEAAAGAARIDRNRLAARLQWAEALDRGGEPRRAVAALQSLLADEGLRLLSVPADPRRTVRADLLIADRLGAILKRGGRELYAEFDARAEELLDRGQQDKDSHLLEEVGRSFPAARVAPRALLSLARLHEEQGRAVEAASTYKRLAAAAPAGAFHARALYGLARCFDSQKLWIPARDAYAEVLARYPDVRLDEDDAGTTLGSLAAGRLAREPFDRLAGDRTEAALPIPLAQRWHRGWPGPVRPLAASGVPPSAETARIFVAEKSVLHAVEPESGAPPWAVDLGGPPIWVGYLADRVLAATETKLMAVSLETGEVLWQHRPGARPEPSSRLNPFAAKLEVDPRPPAPSGPLHDFRLVGDRVFCLRGDRELLAFDGETGLLDWSFAPASGRLNPHIGIGPRRIVLQVLRPGAVLVLETTKGRRLAEFAQGEEATQWLREPLAIDEDHVAVVLDAQAIALLDLGRGTPTWTFRETNPLRRLSAPRLLGDAERLLVLSGHELIRLDAATGAPLWSRPLVQEDLADRPGAVALDGDRLYWIGRSARGTTLGAVALADGSRPWTRDVAGPASPWSLLLTRRAVVAFPTPSPSTDGDLQALPLAFYRRDTGALVQRVVVPGAVTELAVRLAPRGAVVTTQGGLWALGDRRPVDAPGAPR